MVSPCAGSDEWGAGVWRASWIGCPRSATSSVFACRRQFTLDAPATIRVRVTADERYKLYLDGRLVDVGPQRADAATSWPYATHDWALAPGEHVVVALVWALGHRAPSAQTSVHGGQFLLAAEAPYAELLSTGQSPWTCKPLEGFTFTPNGESPAPITGRQLVQRIIQMTGVQPLPDTVDTFKTGDPDAIVTGVASTFIATMDVLRQASDRGLNFIVTHEPTFFDHPDRLDHLGTDPVVKAKLDFIAQRWLTIWRFHDLPHRVAPDMIETGMAELMGWTPRPGRPHSSLFTMPQTSVSELALALKQRTGARALRVVGDPAMSCSIVALRVGASGSEAVFASLQYPETEVLVVGECCEWAHMEYVRDAAAQGRKLAAIVLGHRNSEEPGVLWISRWLAQGLKGIRVEHLSAEDPFGSVEAP